MKIFNITLVLATMVCAFAEASPMKDRMLFKRQADCSAETCPLRVQGIKAFKNFFTMAHDGLQSETAAEHLSIPPEIAEEFKKKITTFTDTLNAAELVGFTARKEVNDIFLASQALIDFTSKAPANLSPPIVALLSMFTLSVKVIGLDAQELINVGCAI
ncbi:hypothetical protein BGZ96_009068 [Linnemannia gamsii]|uniref:Uncharacterized protein n=1 Tax=Linnemannia gamsii TaxID=64522 RepID=A0ABQ7JX10_9FUNG|nr:hypothetical protein BGZ96_009068 [Linnemannia gamsii]